MSTSSSAISSSPPLLKVSGLTKRYGRTAALTDLSLDLWPGQAIGVVGENGAGKSTFAKILAGAVSQDQGSILIEGREAAFSSPRDSQRAGIAFIPQELSFVPNLTVAENLVLNRWPSKVSFTSRSAIRRQAKQQVELFGLDVPLDARMQDLRLADQQMVEILKVLSRESSVLVLDEPTAALSAREALDLFDALERLKSHHLGIILISHRLDEVLRFCDRIDVFRNGMNVLACAPEDTTVGEVIAHMLGKEVQNSQPKKLRAHSSRVGSPTLRLTHWRREAHPQLQDVSLSLWSGEIICLFGVRGCGAETLAEGLIGRHRDIEGHLTLDGIDRFVARSPRSARRLGISYVPPDRKRQGLFIDSTIARNVSVIALGQLSRFGFITTRSEEKMASEWVDRFGVRYRNLGQRVGDLSGGNQQKILLASRLAIQPKVLVLQEPTRGVDVGARVQIHNHLRSIAESGTAILVVTSDVEEAVAVSDRVEVMREGAIIHSLMGAEITQHKCLQASTADGST